MNKDSSKAWHLDSLNIYDSNFYETSRFYHKSVIKAPSKVKMLRLVRPGGGGRRGVGAFQYV